ncbi:hypothetical protein QAD02_020199 [Eretmocerus hayati]|uniref:Uncharacterized protein n=1 Tax=Eretmocerus hayati TaxID=131215 RepID=A0ACC2PLT9_9HYME|nr:hypothetical protein QAD02_020199 [Eretmocerus hayati]
MEFFNKLLNRPSTKPAICHASLEQQQSSEEAQLSRWFSAEGQTSPTADHRQQHQLLPQARGNKPESGEAAAAPSGSGPSSLSSASSFQSLASLSLSSKSSSGICADSAPGSPEEEPRPLSPPQPQIGNRSQNELDDRSYTNAGDISGLDGLISACAGIDLNSGSGNASTSSEANLTDHEPSFASAADDTLEADLDKTKILHEDQDQQQQKQQQPADSEPVDEHERIQAFRTCPALPEKQLIQDVKGDDHLQEQKTSATLSDESTLSSSSEPTVLLRTSDRQQQGASIALDTGAGAEFKSALSSFAPICKTTSQAKANTEAISKFAGCGTSQTSFGHDSSDVSFVEVENFNIPEQIAFAAQEETVSSAIPGLSGNPNSSIPTRTEASACSQVVETNSPENFVDQATEAVSPTKTRIVSSSEIEGCEEREIDTPQENHTFEQSNSIGGGDFEKIKGSVNSIIVVDPNQDRAQKENLLNESQIVSVRGGISNTQDFPESDPESCSREHRRLGSSHEAALKDQSIRLNSVSDARVANNSRDQIIKSTLGTSPAKISFSASVTEDYYTLNSLTSEVVASTPLLVKKLTNSTPPQSPTVKGTLFTQETNVSFKDKDSSSSQEEKPGLDKTTTANGSVEKSCENSGCVHKENLETTELLNNSVNLLPNPEPDYEAFKPQQQSTTLPLPNHCEFEVLEEAALQVHKDIESSFKIEESEQFVSATTDLFGDPAAFDFLDQVGSRNGRRGKRYDSLYMKFDPLAERASMLPQKNVSNSPAVQEDEIEKDTRTEIPMADVNTPKKNPALAAIDRLLFYSPMSQSVTPESKTPDVKEEKEEAEKEESSTVPLVDEKMAKELELVRSTMLQLEEDLRVNQDQSEKQKLAYEEKMSQLQVKLTQEVKCKEQMTVVVEEYEKSISRLIAEREKDRNNFEIEKAKLQEELQVANQHLSNTEAAFSDVHTKYERLKNVISAYKSNEAVLKDSIIENQETIKTLENRYEQLKSHAMAQLEKANLELSAIKKQNEAETVKLKAMVRKAELKSKSLEETVEQKTKENKELTQIIDEMIARVE